VLSAHFTLPPVRTSARAAREQLARLIAGWGDEDARHAVSLLLSEVVTNAVLHARSSMTVHVEDEGDRLRVQVDDQSPVAPVRREAGTDRPGGRGLRLLDALAAEWGVLTGSTGKSVWFEVRAVGDAPGLGR
jgi:anti-sigma regulatory factor (Ser/Thr protein kinase)